MQSVDLLKGYDLDHLSVAVLGGHSALDCCQGAKKYGFKTVVVAQKGREKVYAQHYKTRGARGCIDEVIVVNSFDDIMLPAVQQQLRSLHAIIIQSRYFWVYVKDFMKRQDQLQLPIFGSRALVNIEERGEAYNQYHLLADAGIRTPKIFTSYKDIDRPVLVKAGEAHRKYERAFFIVGSSMEYQQEGSRLESQGRIAANWRSATIEEFVVGAPVNFNFFFSPLTGELELLGTDTRRQTNLDGFLRMTADEQMKALKTIPVKMIETGHIACTVKESLLEKAFDLADRFVKATQALPKGVDPTGRGILGPFALQGSVVADEGKEDIVIFDVSLRIPGSPGIAATPYAGYLFGEPMSVGQRIALELRNAVKEGKVADVVT